MSDKFGIYPVTAVEHPGRWVAIVFKDEAGVADMFPL
jgi:hypothetical protein